MTGKEIIAKAIEVYGEEAQMRQCMEECAELIEAEVSQGATNVVEEMADVAITMEQVAIILGVEEKIRVPLPMPVATAEGTLVKWLAKLIKVINKRLRGETSAENKEQITGCISEIRCRIASMLGADEVRGEEFEKVFKEKLLRLKKRLGV